MPQALHLKPKFLQIKLHLCVQLACFSTLGLPRLSRPNVFRRGVSKEFADKVGVVYFIGCGPRPTKSFVHRLQFCLKLAMTNLTEHNIK